MIINLPQSDCNRCSLQRQIKMIRILAVAMFLGLQGCAYDHFTANEVCGRSAGCVSSFPNTGNGPIQAQAVAPDNAGLRAPN